MSDDVFDSPALHGGVVVEQPDDEQSIFGEPVDEVLRTLKEQIQVSTDPHESDEPGIELIDFLMGSVLRQRAAVAVMAVICESYPELASSFMQAAFMGSIRQGLVQSEVEPADLMGMQES